MPKLPDKINFTFIQKSNPLLSLAKSGIPLPSLKILDAYLAKVDMKDPSTDFQYFGIQELCQMTGANRIRKNDLIKRLEDLKKGVDIEDDKNGDKKNHHVNVTPIEIYDVEYDSKGYVTRLGMQCTRIFKRYVFNIEDFGYTNYRIQQTNTLKSSYSYWMALYLLTNKGFRKEWNVSIEKLMDIVGYTTQEVEYVYRYFSRDVLKKAKEELDTNKKCDVSFDFYPIRTGKKITHIHMILIDKAPKLDAMGNYIGTATEIEKKKTDKKEESKHEGSAPTASEQKSQSEEPATLLLLISQRLEQNYALCKDIDDSLQKAIKHMECAEVVAKMVAEYGINDESTELNTFQYKKLVAKNIEIGKLIVENTSVFESKRFGRYYANETYLKKALEIYDVICDIVCNKRKSVTISDTSYPWETVRTQFLKLDYDAVFGVLGRVKESSQEIRNMYAYLVSCLYKASMSETIANEANDYANFY